MTGQGGAGGSDGERVRGRLARAVAEQLELCRRLRDLSERQAALVRGADGEALLALLAEREAVIERMEAVRADAGPLMRAWERGGGAEEGWGEGLAGLRAQVSEIGALLAEVQRRDESDRAELERARSVLAEELGELRAGQGAVAAYTSPAVARGARFQDREG